MMNDTEVNTSYVLIHHLQYDWYKTQASSYRGNQQHSNFVGNLNEVCGLLKFTTSVDNSITTQINKTHQYDNFITLQHNV